MSAAAFFRLKKLKGGGILLAAARHNRRTIQAELGADSHINPARSHLNETLCGPPSPDGVAQQAKDAMQAAGVGKLRKDAVVGLEAVFSLPVGHVIDRRQYFAQCVEWAGVQFGGAANIMSADIHHDEAQPHVHVLLVPLVNSRMVGSDMVGNRQTLLALQSKFFDEVARRFGLTKPPARLMGTAKTDAAARVIAAMKASNDPAIKSAAWAVIRAAIECDPAPFMAALGVVMAPKAKHLRSSTAIFTSPGKGPKTEAKQLKPYRVQSAEKEQTLSCVGFASKSPPSIAPISAPTAVQRGSEDRAHIETVRVRDDDMHAESWDSDTGTFHPKPHRDHSQRAAAQAWVSDALRGIKAHRVSATNSTLET
ncbi:plasmid recombination protein [Aquabacterium sp.]|uniref:plasmid recombination protein n=1 Tax=Aquabacterium sp. TaxID=1872578 RepID=UPI002489B544|nr:plasmid recombination protein [Aquabacterium sp.]MDI1259589.1 plasmid recombination protein [Aquabacterium sp.]